MSKKSWPNLYSTLLYEVGQDFWTNSILREKERKFLLKYILFCNKPYFDEGKVYYRIIISIKKRI